MPSRYTPPDVIVEQRRRTLAAPRQAPLLSPVVVGAARQIVVRESVGEYEVGSTLTAPIPGLAPGAIVDEPTVEVFLNAVAANGAPLGLFQLSQADGEYTLLPIGPDRKTALTVDDSLAIEYSILSRLNNSPDTLTATDTAQGFTDGIFFQDTDVDFLSRGATVNNTFVLIDSPSAVSGRYVIRELIPTGANVYEVRLERVDEDGVPILTKGFDINFNEIPADRFVYGFPADHAYSDLGETSNITVASVGLGLGVVGIVPLAPGVTELDDTDIDALVAPGVVTIPDLDSSDSVWLEPVAGTPDQGAELEVWQDLIRASQVGNWMRLTGLFGTAANSIRDYRIAQVDTTNFRVLLQHPDLTPAGGSYTIPAAAGTDGHVTSIQVLEVLRGANDLSGSAAAGDYFVGDADGTPFRTEILHVTPGLVELAEELPALSLSANTPVAVQRGIPFKGVEASYDLTRRITTGFGGGVLISYQAQRVDLKLNGLMDIGNQRDIEDQIGLIHPDNPLALGCDMVTRSGLTDGTRVFFAMATDDDTLAGHQAALDTLETQEVYYVVPLTQSKAILSIYKSHVEVQSQPKNGHERVLLASTEISTVDPVIPSTTEAALTQGEVDSGDARQFNITDNLGSVNPGDNLVVMSGSDQETASVLVTRRIETVSTVGGFVVVLEEFPAAYVGETVYFKIETYPRTKGEQAQDWRDYALSLNSSRVMLIRPDRCEITYTDKTGLTVRDRTIEVPMYYGCCAFAGLAASLRPQAPMTNVQVSGINRLVNSNFYFTPGQLNVIAEGGNNILVQASRNSSPFSRHQLTTEMLSIITREFSIVKLVDFSAKFFRDSLRPYIGNHNITAEYLSQLRGISEAIIRALVDTNVLLPGTTLEALYQDQDEPDSVIIEVGLDVPYPCNRIRVILYI